MDERDEVVTEFDQTNGKVSGLEGDGGDVDRDPDGDLREDGERKPIINALVDEVDDVVNGRRDDERRD